MVVRGNGGEDMPQAVKLCRKLIVGEYRFYAQYAQISEVGDDV